ncbi:MAG TPA: EAL domain-containing protein [Rhodanobacteraceae bacterium]
MAHASLTQRLRPLGYTLVAVVALVLFLTWVALQAQTALASFLNADTTWLNAQTQATTALLEYADAGHAADYAAFQRNYATLDAFMRAREQVLSGRFSYDAVETELSRGGARLVALRATIFLFAHFAGAPYLKQAIALWRSTDAPVEELQRVAAVLHRGYSVGTPPPAVIARQRARIRAISAFIAPTNQRFSLTVARGAVVGGRLLFAAILVLAAAALALWMGVARRVLARIHAAEERYRLLFDNAPDAVVMVEGEAGRILAANGTAAEWAGCTPTGLRGETYADLFARGGLREATAARVASTPAGEPWRWVETQARTVLWNGMLVRQAVIRDVSARLESERERRMQAAALANIGEGVLIADAQRRIVSVNAAAVQITGSAAEHLLGARLEDGRCLPDGDPLPATLWADVARGVHWSGDVVSRRFGGATYPERLVISAIRDGGQVRQYVAVFSDISDIQAAHRRLRQLATEDALTGLVNRVEFQRLCNAAFAAAQGAGALSAVLFVDMDGFKQVNDRHGHATGDALLQLVAQRIRRQLRSGDVAARIGGDEFAILLAGLDRRDAAAPLADRLLSALSEPFRVGEVEVTLGASVGVAAYPTDGEDAKTLLAHADAAMYVAKAAGRGTWQYFAPEMRADKGDAAAFATELRGALARDELRMLYQPIVEMGSGRIVAAEALLRWRHPQRGDVLPDAFIPQAEAVGLTRSIDQWVLRAVCAQIHAWDAAGGPAIPATLNVSAGSFDDPAFAGDVVRVLHAAAVAPERIVIEITEGAMLHTGVRTQRTLAALHRAGIRIAIDDFGTGYASMSYLKLPAVDYVKIDRSFIAGLPGDARDSVITSAILAIAQCLGPVVIAEGIETDAQHRCLLNAGCTRGQGFLYSHPVDPAALAELVQRAA